MAITHSQYLDTVLTLNAVDEKRVTNPIPRIWNAVDPPFKGHRRISSDGFEQSSSSSTIVIDNGTCAVLPCLTIEADGW